MEPKLSPRDLNKVPACHGRDETPTCEEDAWGGHEKVAQHGCCLLHISEPTRLGMISYAVFCLKKKITRSTTNNDPPHTSTYD